MITKGCETSTKVERLLAGMYGVQTSHFGTGTSHRAGGAAAYLRAETVQGTAVKKKSLGVLHLSTLEKGMTYKTGNASS